MTRLHKRVSFSNEERPQFFKVFIPRFSSKQMLLPPAFVGKFIPKTPEKTVLRNCSGKSWDIAVVNREKKVYFGTGWEDFAKEQSLEFGDFLLFRYSNVNSLFDVEIFGKNGCKKELTALPKVRGRVKTEAEETENDGIGLSGSMKKPGSSEERQVKTRVTRSAKDAVQTNLHFSVMLNNGKTNQCSACIPRAVFKEINFKAEVALRYQDDKLWPVRILFRRDGRGGITTGWSNFQKDNNLKANDKCVFEPVLGKGKVCKEIKVQVIRAGTRRSRKH